MVGEKLPSVVGDCGNILEFQWERKLEEVGQKKRRVHSGKKPYQGRKASLYNVNCKTANEKMEGTNKWKSFPHSDIGRIGANRAL